jgi:hypothetical protein
MFVTSYLTTLYQWLKLYSDKLRGEWWIGNDVKGSERDQLCGLVVSVADYKHRGPGFDSRALFKIFLRELGLERGPLSLVIG